MAGVGGGLFGGIGFGSFGFGLTGGFGLVGVLDIDHLFLLTDVCIPVGGRSLAVCSAND